MLSGLVAIWTVFLHTFRRRVTVQFPDEVRRLPPRSRGRVILTRNPDGSERCTACNRCVVACPAGCITLKGEKNEQGKRFAAGFQVDFGRCISCGYCEEVCPTSAIQLVPEIEGGELRRSELVRDKEDLLVNGPGKFPGVDPGEEARLSRRSAG